VKSAAERSIEALTWSSVVIWLGFALVAHILNYVWLVVMVLGIILLSSAIYQRSRGWQTSLSIWIFGIWMAVFSVIETVSALLGTLGSGGLTIDLWVYLGIALVSMGVAVVLRSVQGPSLTSGVSRTAQPDEQRTSYGTTPPRRVNEDYSAGYIPPSGSAARYGDEQQPYGAPTDPYNQPPQYGKQPADQYDQPPQYGRQPTDPYNQPPQYGRQPANQYDQPPQYGRQPDPYNQPPQYGRQPASQYDQPPQYGRQPANQYDQPPQYDSYEQQPSQDYYYEQPAQPPNDYAPGWDQPAPPPGPPAPGDRRRARRGRRTARRVDEPSDLESRVEDIIQRSRDRRNQPPDDNLPY